MAGRGAGDRVAQSPGLYRPVGLVAEVFPTPTGAVLQHLVEEQSPVRVRPPNDHHRSLAVGFRGSRLPRGGAAVDPEGECGEAPWSSTISALVALCLLRISGA